MPLSKSPKLGTEQPAPSKPLSEASRLLIVAGLVAGAMVLGGGTVYFLMGRSKPEVAPPPYYPPVVDIPQPQQQPARSGQPRGGNPAPTPVAAAPASNDPVKNAIDARLANLDKLMSAKNAKSTDQVVDDLKNWIGQEPRRAAAVLGETWSSKNIVPRLVKEAKAYRQTIDLIDSATAALNAGGPDTLGVGGIGVGTFDTKAEYRNVRVEQNGQVVYLSDFGVSLPNVPLENGWKVESGKWEEVDGAYRPTTQGTFVSYCGEQPWSNYILTLQARKLAGKEGFLIIFGHKGSDKLWWNLGGWGNTAHGIEFNGGWVDQSAVGAKVPGTIATNRWYNIKIEVKGSEVSCYLDNQLIQQATLNRAALDLQIIQGMRHWKAAALIGLSHGDEAAELVQANFASGWSDGTRLLNDIITPMGNAKQNPALLQVTQHAMLSIPDNSALVETCLNQRIAAFNADKKYLEALAGAKVLFNYATMEHTSDALKTLDRQLQLVNAGNKTQVDLFHREEEQGAAAPAEGKPIKSTVLAGIKVDPATFAAEADAITATDYAGLVRKGSLLLLADKGERAVETFKKAAGTVRSTDETKTINTWIARAIKAEDGTIGRANQWITSNGK